MVGTIFLCDGKFVRIAGERDDGCAGTKQLGVLDRIGAKATDTEHANHSIGAEPAGIAYLLEAAIGRQPCVSKGCKLLEFEVPLPPDDIACRNRNIFRESAIRAEARPAHIGADMCVADLAMAADSVAPSGRDHHMVAFLEARGFWNDAANLF